MDDPYRDNTACHHSHKLEEKELEGLNNEEYAHCALHSAVRGPLQAGSVL